MATDDRYPREVLDGDDDDGTIVENVDALASDVIGHRIVKVEQGKYAGKLLMGDNGFIEPGHGQTFITLDNGKTVVLSDTDDCCAYTTLEAFLLHPERVDHIITGVGTTDGYTTWHIYADFGDVLELTVGWSCGNPFYYGYGFVISVIDTPKDGE